MKNSFLIVILFLTNVFFNREINVFIKVRESRLTYKIVNKENMPIYIPKRYTWRQSKDSIVMEAIYKPGNNQVPMSYNAFVLPEMKQINKQASSVASISMGKTLKVSNLKFYFRVYCKNDTVLLKKGQTESSKEEFLAFERKNAVLIEAQSGASIGAGK